MKKINKDILNSLTDNIKDTSLKGKIDGYRQKIHNQAVEAEYADYEKGVDDPDKDYEEEEWKKASNDPEFRDIYEAIRRYQYGSQLQTGEARKVYYSDDELKGIVKNSNKENDYDKLDKDTLNKKTKKLN